MIVVFRYRVKSLTGLLDAQARACNLVWNYCNDAQKHACSWNKRWLTGFDLNRLTAGSGKELGLHSCTVNAVCEQYAKSRIQHKRPRLRYRGKKSLGWVPLKGRALKVAGADFMFHGRRFRVFNSRRIPEGAKIKDGSNFSRDTRGRWFLNVVTEIADGAKKTEGASVGIDLGVKTFAALSTGEKIENPRILAKYASKLAVAQRANKKRQAAKVHDKIANTRHDFQHKCSTRLAKEFSQIFVGNINASALAKTSMAKAVLDVGWSSFRSMLAYKAIRHGAIYTEVDEKFTTQTCSRCGSVGGPKGQTGLNEREWTCSECGAWHDRDVNSALNILNRGRGHTTPAVGILTL
jgi:IS605 OrfB family transposase